MPLLYSERSLDFDSVDDYVALGDVSELSFEWSDAFSISAWIKVSPSIISTKAILSKKEATGNLTGWLYGVRADGNLALAFTTTNPSTARDLSVRSDGRSLIDDEWHHVVMVYDGSGVVGGISFFADGESLSTVGIETDAMSFTIQITEGASIGSRNDTTTGLAFEGRIDEVSVYNKALSAAEVSTIYNGGLPPDLTVNGPTAGLIGYWPLGEHSFPTVPDLSPSGNDGTMTNMAADDIVVDAPRPSEAFYSYFLGGVDEYVTMGNVAELAFERTDSFSLSLWVKDVGLGAIETLMGKRSGAGDVEGYSIDARNDGGLVFYLRNQTGDNAVVVANNTDINDGEWHHIVCTYNGSSSAAGMEIYFDTVASKDEVAEDTLLSSILTTAPFTLGSLGGSARFARATLCEASIWSKELTPLEVQFLYNGGRPRDARTLGISSDLAGYWPVQGRGGYPTLVDLSANGNNGTATNMDVSDVKLDAPGIDFSLPSVSLRSIEFNGDGKVVTPPTSSMQFDRADSFSHSVWFKTTSGSQSLIGNLDSTQTFKGWETLMLSDGTLRAQMVQTAPGNELIWDSDLSYNDGVWHHLVVTYPGDELTFTLYIDGVLVPFTPVRQETFTGSTASSQGVSIGGRNHNYLYWDGFIDDVAIYNRVLTEVEVRTLYGARGPTDVLELLPLANLVGYWRLGDYAFPNVPDLSGNGHDAVMSRGLHKQRVVNDRPPAAPLTQFANGTEGVLTAPSNPFNFGKDDSFSISCWFRTTSGVNQYPPIVRHTDDGSGGFGYTRGYILGVEGFSTWIPGSLYLILAHDNSANTEIQVDTTIAYNDGVWRHLVVTYNGSGLSTGVRFYINGSLAGAVSRWNALGANDFQTSGEQPLFVENATNPGTGAEGAVCQVAIYSKALSVGEVATLYGGGNPPDLSSVGPFANLEGYWPILDTDLVNLPTVADASGNNRNLTAQETSESIVEDAPAPLESTYCVNFDGVLDTVSVGDHPPFQFERTDSFTLMAWVKATSGAAGGFILSKNEDANGFSGYVLGITVSGGNPYLFLRGVNPNVIQAEVPIDLRDDTWHHLAATYDGSNSNPGCFRLYLDGVEQSTTITGTSVTTTILNPAGFQISGRDAANSADLFPFTGLIDSPAVYNRVLSPSEVALLGGQFRPVDHQAVGPVDSLVGWWRMGDDGGPSVYPWLADFSAAQGNTGAMISMTSASIILDAPGPLAFVPIEYGGYIAYPTGYLASVGASVSLGYGENTVGVDFTPIITYKMRAEADPGPGYVTWTTMEEPDFSGASAPSPIVAGTVTLADSWGRGISYIQQQPVLTVDILQAVSDSSLVSDPGNGVVLVLVTTSAASWSDLDTLTLPALPVAGAEVMVKDNSGSADTFRIEILGGGHSIDGSPSRVLDTSWASVRLIFNGTEWSIVG